MSLSITLGLSPFIAPIGRSRVFRCPEMICHVPVVKIKPPKKAVPVRKATRVKIIEVLKSSNEFSADEVSVKSGKSMTIVRQHLRDLKAAGKIESRAVAHNRHIYRWVS